MIELGGNINLKGFDDLEPMQMIVAKKIIGNYAKKVSDAKKNNLKTFTVIKNGQNIQIHIELINGAIKVNAENSNWFCALGQALLKSVEKTI
ncbi:MAG: hypothetical protein ABIF40_04550 [archaeon]